MRVGFGVLVVVVVVDAGGGGDGSGFYEKGNMRVFSIERRIKEERLGDRQKLYLREEVRIGPGKTFPERVLFWNRGLLPRPPFSPFIRLFCVRRKNVISMARVWHNTKSAEEKEAAFAFFLLNFFLFF